MDEQRKKLIEFIENSDIQSELKTKQLEIVHDETLSISEIKMKIATLICDEFDKHLLIAGMNSAVPFDQSVADAKLRFEQVCDESSQGDSEEGEGNTEEILG